MFETVPDVVGDNPQFFFSRRLPVACYGQ